MENPDKNIERAKQGDAPAFNSIILYWQQPIYNYVLHQIGHHEDAQDLVQLIFLRAFEKIKTLDDTARFKSWLYAIALNACRDERRRKNRSRTYVFSSYGKNGTDAASPDTLASGENTMQDEAMGSFPGSGGSGFERSVHDPGRVPAELHRQDIMKLLRMALEQIPSEQREIVILKELQELKFAEIAEILNLPLNTVKSRMYYGLKALNKIFKKLNLDKEELYYEL